MKIFVISLLRSPDRKETFNTYNSQYISYEYIEAIDGKLLDRNNLSSNIIDINKCIFSDGSLGCALSHLNLWQKCIELNEPIIIMEDDAIVNKNFTLYLDQIMNTIPDNFDIIQLCYNFNSVLSYQVTNYNKSYLLFENKKITFEDIKIFTKQNITPSVAKLYNSFGLSCYVISPIGARIMINNCFPLTNGIIHLPFNKQISYVSIDSIMNGGYKDINAFVSLQPFVIVPHKADFNPSTIT